MNRAATCCGGGTTSFGRRLDLRVERDLGCININTKRSVSSSIRLEAARRLPTLIMFVQNLLALGLFAASSLASPVGNPHVVHEKRTSIPHGWAKRAELRGSMVLPMKVALTQNNLDKGHDWLMDVSHPQSKSYGKHWSAEDIANTFAPRSVQHLHTIDDYDISRQRSILYSRGYSGTRCSCYVSISLSLRAIAN